VGRYSSLAADTFGDVHMSYYDETNHVLKYASNASGGWSTETVDDTARVGRYSSLAADAFGDVHISYYDETNHVLKYASNASGVWLTETVDDTARVGRYTSIAVDDSGMVHLSYYDDANQAVKYATNGSGLWVTDNIDSSPNVGEATSLCLDASGIVHLCYSSYRSDEDRWMLRHACNPSGGWQTETLVDGDLGSGWCSVASDASDIVHVSYYAFDLEEVRGALHYLTLAFVSAGNGEEFLTLSCAHTLTHVASVANPSPVNTPSGVDFPYGFFGFSVTGVGAGGHTEVRFTLRHSGTTLPNTYYKHDSGGWYEFLYDTGTQTGAEIDGNMITLHFVDGGRGDDSSQEGEIVDPGGPGVQTKETGGSGGGGGCFISAAGSMSWMQACGNLARALCVLGASSETGDEKE
jgi:hypothetical protein